MNNTKDSVISYIDNFLKSDYLSLKENLQKLLKDYNRKSKRLDKIIKQSDKQQLLFMELNEQIAKQKEVLNELYAYDKQQQLSAKEKIDLTIVDDLKEVEKFKSKTIYHPADILSGDFYSIHTLKDDSTLLYVIDGQGHGISPSLTVFAVSSTISFLIEEDISFKEMIHKLFPMIQKVLGEIEQLTYTIIYIDKERENISYLSGGMYPFLIKQNNNILKYKVNNLPFMNFSPTPQITSVCIQNWDTLLVYTDGLVEDLGEDMSEFSPSNFIQNEQLFETFKNTIEDKKFEDDITVVQILK